jgi:GTP-binding protein
LQLYDPLLAAKPWTLLANKMDLEASAENLAQLQSRFPKVPIFPIAADTGRGIPELKAHLDTLARAAGLG